MTRTCTVSVWKIDTTHMSFRRMIHIFFLRWNDNLFFFQLIFFFFFLLACLLLYRHCLFVMLCIVSIMSKFHIHPIDVCNYVACRSNCIWYRSGAWAARLAEESAVLCEFHVNYVVHSARVNNSWLYGCRWIFGRLPNLLCICLLLCTDGGYNDRCEIITWRPGWHSKRFLGHKIHDCDCNCDWSVFHSEWVIWYDLDVDRIDWWHRFHSGSTCALGRFCTQLGRNMGRWVMSIDSKSFNSILVHLLCTRFM